MHATRIMAWVLWTVLVLAITYFMAKSGWNFRLQDASHWAYMGQVIGSWWSNGTPPVGSWLPFVLTLSASAIVWALLGWNIIPKIPAVEIALPKSALAWLGLPFVWFGKGFMAAGGGLVKILGWPVQRLLKRFETRTRRREAGIMGVRDSEWTSPPAGARFAIGATTTPFTEETETTENIERPRKKVTITPTATVPSKTPEAPQKPVQDAAPARVHDNDVRADVQIFLKNHGWTTFPDIHVNANAGAGFAPGRLGSEPEAVIPILAFSESQIQIIHVMGLGGSIWQADLWQDGQVPDNPLWANLDGGNSRTCPVFEVLSMRERFLDHHGGLLDSFGFPSSEVGACLVTGGGEIVNVDSLLAGFEEIGGFYLAELDKDGELENAFGDESVSPANADLVHTIKDESDNLQS